MTAAATTVWAGLDQHFSIISLSRATHLIKQLTTIKMGTKFMHGCLNEIQSLVDKLMASHYDIPIPQIIIHTLDGLPNEFDSICPLARNYSPPFSSLENFFVFIRNEDVHIGKKRIVNDATIAFPAHRTPHGSVLSRLTFSMNYGTPNHGRGRFSSRGRGMSRGNGHWLKGVVLIIAMFRLVVANLPYPVIKLKYAKFVIAEVMSLKSVGFGMNLRHLSKLISSPMVKHPVNSLKFLLPHGFLIRELLIMSQMI